MAEPHLALFYEYVEDVAERRAPYREGHLELIRRFADEGLLVLAGALGDPPHGALLVFRTEDPDEVDRFAEQDPYVEGGLVTGRRVERLNVVT